mgnify:CR=1 FL=1
MQNQYIYYRDGEYLSHWEWIEPISLDLDTTIQALVYAVKKGEI